jgi:integrase/recombinase XerD
MSIVIPQTAFERAALRYVRHQHALGIQLGTVSWVLRRLDKFLDGEELTEERFVAWMHTRSHCSRNTRRNEALAVRRLCLYRRRSEPECFVPDPLHFPRRVPHRPPVIVTPAQVAKMLVAIDRMPPAVHFPLGNATLRTALILLYTTGIRRGEAVHLTLSDIDLKRRVLRIRESKFHKDRLVPLSPSTTRALRAFLQLRLRSPWDIGPEAPLFGHQHGTARFRAYVGAALGAGVRRAFEAADIHDGHGHRPHVHDLRHSFAVQALLRWYRNGTDVQAKLPQLSMYMGHVSIVSTAHYLHFLPEVAAQANRRLERYFGPIARGGVR